MVLFRRMLCGEFSVALATTSQKHFYARGIDNAWNEKIGIVSKPVQKLVGKLTLFQGISQVLRHHKTT